MPELSSFTPTPAIIWHALSVTLAWSILSPLSHLSFHVKPLTRSVPVFRAHRYIMSLVVLLTIQAYVIAFFTSPPSTPKQHPAFASILVVFISIQSLIAFNRPNPQQQRRRFWRYFHTFTGACTSLFALFILQHSVVVFHVDGWLRIVVYTCVSIGSVIACIAIVLQLVQNCSRKDEQNEQKEDYQILNDEDHHNNDGNDDDDSGNDDVDIEQNAHSTPALDFNTAPLHQLVDNNQIHDGTLKQQQEH